jgi:hypothetical protein
MQSHVNGTIFAYGWVAGRRVADLIARFSVKAAFWVRIQTSPIFPNKKHFSQTSLFIEVKKIFEPYNCESAGTFHYVN